MSYKPIRDYGIIGNLRSAVLVGNDGAIDWAPAPFLDSPSVFAAILDDKKGGYWSIAPTGTYKSTQEYLPETNILITRFKTRTGVLEVMDCLPVKNGGDIEHLPSLSEDEQIFEIHRKAVCVKGSCEMKIVFYPRFDYARGETELSVIEGGISAKLGEKKGVLISKAVYTLESDTSDGYPRNIATAVMKLKEGQAHYATFRYNTVEIPSREDEHYESDMQSTIEFWKHWVHRCDLDACLDHYPWHESVMRSSLVLKIMFFEPPGSIAAAATTSLPEVIGGVRNWDYRFSWIRDSAFAIQALFWLGYLQEANEYVKWLVYQCRNLQAHEPAELQIMYGLRGERKLVEETLDHLDGYMGSKPVRIGNDAYTQKQWDIYGGVLDAAWQMHLRGSLFMKEDPGIWDALRSFANYVVKIWRESDEGIWEVRGGDRHFVHSKVMCWVALDRAIKLADSYDTKGEIEIWKKERDAIKMTVMEKGWSEKKKSFVQSFGSNDVDAAILLMPVVGFIDGKDPRMVSTIAAIEKELSVGDGLLLRYKSDDGLPGHEGAFLLASFWMVDALVYAGEQKKATRLFEKNQRSLGMA